MRGNAKIDVVGLIWMPAVTCAYTYRARIVEPNDPLFAGDIALTGRPDADRELILNWLYSNAGDFRAIQDFYADLPDGSVIPFATEEGEMAYCDCFP